MTAKKAYETLAEVAVIGKPGERIRAVKEIFNRLDKNIALTGKSVTGKASKTLPDGSRVSVSVTGVVAVQDLQKLFDSGLGSDGFPLYSPDLKERKPVPSEIDGLIVNPESGDSNGVQDTKSQETSESSSSSRPAPSSDGETPQRSGRDGGEAEIGGTEEDSGPDLGCAEPSLGEPADGDGRGGVLESLSTITGERIDRHIGHFPPCGHVPGGGVTGVPNGADAFEYGRDRCIQIEEARRLARSSTSEGTDEQTLADDAAAECAAEETISFGTQKHKEESAGGGRPIQVREIGPISVFDLVRRG
jgi:hypothetical protein